MAQHPAVTVAQGVDPVHQAGPRLRDVRVHTDRIRVHWSSVDVAVGHGELATPERLRGRVANVRHRLEHVVHTDGFVVGV